LAAASSNPSEFISGLEGPVILDEVQRVPELFIAIKAAVDRDRRPGRFLLTGSANVLLLPTLSDSLAGRMEILQLWPLSQGEIEGTRESFVDAAFSDSLSSLHVEPCDRRDLIERALLGGFPEPLERPKQSRRNAWFGSYTTTILQRDVRDIAHVNGLTEMPRLLSLLAARAASLLNFSELSRTSGIPQTTLKRYMALLQASFLIQCLPAWSGNLGKRLVKSPKVFLTDTGLLASLLGITRESFVVSPGLTGPLLENFVAMELAKQVTWSETKPRLFHFRAHTGREVDIVLEKDGGELVGIEVKASGNVSKADFSGLLTLREGVGKRFRCGVVLYTGEETVAFEDRLLAVPTNALWQG
jgi:predicted AAA+ superfamily ATPase